MELETVFLYIFIGTLVVLFANILLGNLLDIIFHITSGLFNITTTFCFVGFTSAIGYVLTKQTDLNLYLLLIISGVISLGVTTILNMFVFIPLSKLESTTGYRVESLAGEEAEVTLTILPNYLGEVVIRTPLGIVTKTAKSYSNEEISQGESVLVIDVEGQIVVVKKYENPLKKLED